MISSPQNENFKRWSSLTQSRGIKKHGQYLLFGKKVVSEALANDSSQIVERLSTTEPDTHGDKVKTHQLSTALFNELDLFGSHSDILVMQTPTLPNWDGSPQGLTVVCPLGDPSNLGSLIRSASAFAANQIVLTTESCNPFHPKSVRASSGAILSAPLFVTDSLSQLQPSPLQSTNNSDDGWFALDAGGQDIATLRRPKNTVLIVGEEGPGIEKLKGIQKVSIPIENKIESLNASIAASIALYEFSKKSF